MVELILQRARTGRYQYPQPREQGRNQVGESLPGAGAGLHQQRLPQLKRLADARGHLLLGRALAEALEGTAERSLGAEYRGEIGHCWIMQPMFAPKYTVTSGPPV